MCNFLNESWCRSCIAAQRQMINTWDDWSGHSKCVSATPSGTSAIPYKTRENNPWMLPLTPVTPFNQATCLSPLSSRTALTSPLASPTESSLGHYSVLSKPVTALCQRIRSKRRSIVLIFFNLLFPPPKVDLSLCFVATFTVGSIKAQRIGVHGTHGYGQQLRIWIYTASLWWFPKHHSFVGHKIIWNTYNAFHFVKTRVVVCSKSSNITQIWPASFHQFNFPFFFPIFLYELYPQDSFWPVRKWLSEKGFNDIQYDLNFLEFNAISSNWDGEFD